MSNIQRIRVGVGTRDEFRIQMECLKIIYQVANAAVHSRAPVHVIEMQWEISKSSWRKTEKCKVQLNVISPHRHLTYQIKDKKLSFQKFLIRIFIQFYPTQERFESAKSLFHRSSMYETLQASSAFTRLAIGSSTLSNGTRMTRSFSGENNSHSFFFIPILYISDDELWVASCRNRCWLKSIYMESIMQMSQST